ncbi:hypothetical protein FB567DRAFT_276478 [Paraphoma chrysanthemicola]|uniref:Uncharacterized protein n=1 Tax=Paraphoma chrysanthemicola TaxID=798071 RepID=A0A8K0W1R9_9PLEO|nr:hypothetical protein FB567DRAFT_276478 [Paraphoma chrysanthemicola]
MRKASRSKSNIQPSDLRKKIRGPGEKILLWVLWAVSQIWAMADGASDAHYHPERETNVPKRHNRAHSGRYSSRYVDLLIKICCLLNTSVKIDCWHNHQILFRLSVLFRPLCPEEEAIRRLVGIHYKRQHKASRYVTRRIGLIYPVSRRTFLASLPPLGAETSYMNPRVTTTPAWTRTLCGLNSPKVSMATLSKKIHNGSPIPAKAESANDYGWR